MPSSWGILGVSAARCAGSVTGKALFRQIKFALDAQKDSSYTKIMKRRSRRLAALARRIMRLPYNKPGTDKTFVHIAAHQYMLHRRAVRPA